MKHPATRRRGGGALIAALATGALLVASVPPIDFGIVAWVAFWPLLAACRGRGVAARGALGCVAGLAFGVGTVGLWLLPATRAHLAAGAPTAVALTLAAAWLYGGLYIALLAVIHELLPRPRWLSTPAAWVLLEWMRGFVAGGAPWALLGHSQHDALVAQIAELGGVPALSFLLMLTSAALAERGRPRCVGVAVALLAIALASAFGVARLAALPPSEGDTTGVEVAILSGYNLERDPVAAYADATGAASAADLVVWPEGVTSGYLQEEPAVAAAIASSAAAHAGLLVGGRRYAGAPPARRYFNSVFLFDGRPAIAAIVDKQRLVPFAEYSPLPWLFDVPRPFSPSVEPPMPLDAAGIRIGPLVCWDVLFDDVARALVQRGADLLVNLSSDRDLGAGAQQLLAFARFRAIETRRWLARASGTGRSYVVDPAGRVLARDRLRIAAASDRPQTLYTRHGELVPGLAALVLTVCFALRPIAARAGPHRRDPPADA